MANKWLITAIHSKNSSTNLLLVIGKLWWYFRSSIPIFY